MPFHKAADCLTRQTARTTCLAKASSLSILVYGHTSCSRPSNAARCVFTNSEAVRLPALPGHLDPLSLL